MSNCKLIVTVPVTHADVVRDAIEETRFVRVGNI